jgi:hypothetical protein
MHFIYFSLNIKAILHILIPEKLENRPTAQELSRFPLSLNGNRDTVQLALHILGATSVDPTNCRLEIFS